MTDESKIWSELNDTMNNDRLEGPAGYFVLSSRPSAVLDCAFWDLGSDRLVKLGEHVLF